MALVEGLFEHIDGVIDNVTSSLTKQSPHDDEDSKERSPPKADDADESKVHDNGVVINGVTLPKVVVDQLRLLGVTLSWYSKGELEAAINSCSIDCNLIDDPDGITFFDDLKYDHIEREESEGEFDITPHRKNRTSSLAGITFSEHSQYTRSALYDTDFRERIRAERTKDREQRKNLLHTTIEDVQADTSKHPLYGTIENTKDNAPALHGL